MQQLMQAGYEHYELSNYALPGHACAHNLTYWHSRPFYGFGLGAASLLGGQRLSRPRVMSQYRCAESRETVMQKEACGIPVTTSLDDTS
jgi:coproporphyrinogen III oxidase-like Fe-S oxidoreductase